MLPGWPVVNGGRGGGRDVAGRLVAGAHGVRLVPASYHWGQRRGARRVVAAGAGVPGTRVVTRRNELTTRHQWEAGVGLVARLARNWSGRLRRERIVEVVESHG